MKLPCASLRRACRAIQDLLQKIGSVILLTATGLLRLWEAGRGRWPGDHLTPETEQQYHFYPLLSINILPIGRRSENDKHGVLPALPVPLAKKKPADAIGGLSQNLNP